MTAETAVPIEEGALVKMSRELTAEECAWARLPHGGQFQVDEFMRAADNTDPEPGDIAVDFYEGTDGTGSSCWVPADAVELVKSAAQMRARKVPAREEIAKELGITDGWSDAFEIDEWIRSGDEIECYGKTAEGLPFGFRVKVIAAWETDL